MSVEHAPAGATRLLRQRRRARPADRHRAVEPGVPRRVAARDPAQFAAWGWRVPFLASAVLVAVGLFIRVGLAESPAFAEVPSAARRAGCRCSTSCAAAAARCCWPREATPASARSATSCSCITCRTRPACCGCPLPTVLALLLVAAVLFARVGRGVRALVRSHRPPADHGVGQRARWSSWSAVFFPLLDTRSMPLITLALACMLVAAGRLHRHAAGGVCGAVPAAIRYSGASLSNTLGTILGGAPAPFVVAVWYRPIRDACRAWCLHYGDGRRAGYRCPRPRD